MNNQQLRPVHYWLAATFLYLVFWFPATIRAQEGNTYRLSLQQAIGLARAQNPLVKAANEEEKASEADLKDARTNAWPTIAATGDYQRFTKLTLYESFLGGAHSVPKRPSPNGADLGASASLNLYAGGRQRAFVAEQSAKRTASAVDAEQQSAAVNLQIVVQYLSVVRLNDQKRFIEEQVVRAETRLKNIRALYQNQKVTRSDVLRAELVLSSVRLNLEAALNDIIISGAKLKVLLALPDSVTVLPTDSANMPRPLSDTLSPLVDNAAKNAFVLQRTAANIQAQGARINALKSNYAPAFSLVSAYGINYPNTIFYPPVDQAYSIGFVGFRLTYNISALYQNKNKVLAARTRLQELQDVQRNNRNDISQEAAALLIKYREALNRIIVTQQSIEQARVNYRIVSAKYFNQLALLTDLLDADNLYQESRFELVQAQTGAQLLYYQLLYTIGKL